MTKQSMVSLARTTAAWVAVLINACLLHAVYAQTDNQTQEQQQMTAMLPELAAAVAANPNDLAARGNYAQALFRLGNLPAAWEQLLAGYKIDPNDNGMIQGLQHLFRAFTQQGLLGVGTPQQALLDVLGSPQQALDMPWGKRLVFAYLAVDLRDDRIHEIVDLRGITEKAFRPSEIVLVELDGRGWHAGFREKTHRSVVAMYYPPGESVSQWQEMITVERFIDGVAAGTLEDVFATMIKQIKIASPECKEMILASSDDSLMVALEGLGQPGQPKMQQLVRLFRGGSDLHRLAYTIKSDSPPDRDQQMKWLEIFQSAQLRAVDADK